MTAQQTHERNLAWIDYAVGSIGTTTSTSNAMKYMNSLRANRAVLERHGPDEMNECRECRGQADHYDAGKDYPCPTTTDITEGLGIK